MRSSATKRFSLILSQPTARPGSTQVSIITPRTPLKQNMLNHDETHSVLNPFAANSTYWANTSSKHNSANIPQTKHYETCSVQNMMKLVVFTWGALFRYACVGLPHGPCRSPSSLLCQLVLRPSKSSLNHRSLGRCFSLCCLRGGVAFPVHCRGG
jgi:hypothetical protein